MAKEKHQKNTSLASNSDLTSQHITGKSNFDLLKALESQNKKPQPAARDVTYQHYIYFPATGGQVAGGDEVTS